MDYPSLSLKQDVIDQAFSSELKPSRTLYFKEYLKQQKENMLKNSVMEECDQCDYKTMNHRCMFQHKRVHHSDTKQQCSECDFSHFYPNRVRTHFKQVHLGIKRKKKSYQTKCQKDSCEYFGTTHCLDLTSHSKGPLRCQRKWCKDFGKTYCTELAKHCLFICEQCKLTFDRSDALKFHNEKIHEGIVYNCELCKTYSVPRKSSLARHVRSKHSDVKPNHMKPKFCIEEGCAYKTFDTQRLNQHIESKHEGIIRFKCNVTNCTSGFSRKKEFQRHAKTHVKKKHPEVERTCAPKIVFCDKDECDAKFENTKELKTHFEQCHEEGYLCSFDDCNYETIRLKYLRKHVRNQHGQKSFTCTEEGCDENLKQQKDLKRHIAVTHRRATKYCCKFEICSFETYEKKYLVNHINNRCKYKDGRFKTSPEPGSQHTQKLRTGKSENVSKESKTLPCEKGESEKSQTVLCGVPGCAYLGENNSNVQQREHFRVNHSNFEWTERSFIAINSAMAEAMDILQEIKKEKSTASTFDRYTPD